MQKQQEKTKHKYWKKEQSKNRKAQYIESKTENKAWKIIVIRRDGIEQDREVKKKWKREKKKDKQ